VFERVLDTPYEICATAITRSTSELVQQRCGAVVAHVALRHGRLRRTLPMLLTVEPWSVDGSSTVVTLEPERRTTPGEHYFRAGHAFLDGVVAQLR